MIIKADIIAEVENRTKFGVFDIDQPLLAIMKDITGSYTFLQKRTTLSISNPINPGTLPSDLVRIRRVEATTGPLDIVPIEELRTNYFNAPTAGTMKSCARFGGYLYLWPPPSAATDIVVWHSYYDDNVDNIELGDEFFEALVEGVCFKLYESKGLAEHPSTKMHKDLYDEQFARLKEAKKELDF